MSCPRLHFYLPAYTQMLAHAAAMVPTEACGLLAGQGEHVSRVFPLPNVAPDPRLGFIGDRSATIAALRTIDRERLSWLATYHSHPPGEPAVPSPADRRGAAGHPGVLQVIVSLSTEDGPTVRAYSLAGGQFTEVDVLTISE
ncbi:MAG: M67 family metallopeptidase [Chloroflexi bacterium]|nr:M67 family metallopeptidase [Chloroflexota bacterium]